MRTPKAIWVIFDPLGGPHLFKSEKAAWKTYRKWERENGDYSYGWCDMSEPIKFGRVHGKRKM